MVGYAVLLGARLFRLRDDQSGDNLYYMGFLFTLTSLAVSLYQFSAAGSAEQIVQNFGIAIASTIAGITLADHVQPDAARPGRDRSRLPAGTGRGLAAGEARTRKLHSRIRLFPPHDPAIHHRRAGRGAGKHRQGASSKFPANWRSSRQAQACRSRNPPGHFGRDAGEPEPADDRGPRSIQGTGAGGRRTRQEHHKHRPIDRCAFCAAHGAPDLRGSHRHPVGPDDRAPDRMRSMR